MQIFLAKGTRISITNGYTTNRLGSALTLMLGFLLSLQGCARTPADIDMIALERTACFGVCPVYRVAIFPDGRVTFAGERFVASPGNHEGRVNADNFRTLAEFAREKDFFTLQDEYRVRQEPDGSVTAVADLPSRVITVRRNGEVKSVLNYFGGPVLLTEFENLIDQLTDSDRWVGSSESPSF